MPRVDYDQIAHLYDDEPMRNHPIDERLITFLRSRADLDQTALRVLDVGCGTGKQLNVNRDRLPIACLVGVDRSRGMLRVARRRRAGIDLVQGDGARLPLASASFDYATNQFSYHHIDDQPAFIREMFRVLRPGGRFVMTNIDPWSMPDWVVYRYFPEALERDQRDFLTSAAFESEMREAGFVEIAVERRTTRMERSLSAFLAYASERHRASQFSALSDVAYEAGLARLRGAVAGDGGRSTTVDLGACLLAISGDRPA